MLSNFSRSSAIVDKAVIISLLWNTQSAAHLGDSALTFQVSGWQTEGEAYPAKRQTGRRSPDKKGIDGRDSSMRQRLLATTGGIGEESACHARDCLQCRRLGFDPWVRKIPLEKEMAAHSSVLAWRIPLTEEPDGLQSMGSQRVAYDWATNTFSVPYPLGTLFSKGGGC